MIRRIILFEYDNLIFLKTIFPNRWWGLFSYIDNRLVYQPPKSQPTLLEQKIEVESRNLLGGLRRLPN